MMAAESEFITVAILEDDPATLEYLTDFFSRADRCEVAFACSTLADANEALKTASADICLVDIRLPDGSGLEFIAPFKEKTGGKALILTVLGDKATVLLAFEFGASGYLLKDTPPDQIISDIRALLRGGNPISPQIATHLLELLKPRPAAEPAEKMAGALSERERDVLRMFSRGLSYKEAARSLDISPHTIADHVKSIYSKMKVHSRNEAVFEAVQQGWLSL
jgi:DNA-binding NarL/FixJ family response regulator